MPALEDFLTHPIESLERALHLRKQIDQLNQTLKELFGPTPISLAGVQTEVPKGKGRKKRSAQARAKMAAAQRARWAGQKGAKPAAAKQTAKGRKKPGGLSAAGRARIIAAQKARWAREKMGKIRKGRQQIADAGQPKFKIF